MILEPRWFASVLHLLMLQHVALGCCCPEHDCCPEHCSTSVRLQLRSRAALPLIRLPLSLCLRRCPGVGKWVENDEESRQAFKGTGQGWCGMLPLPAAGLRATHY